MHWVCNSAVWTYLEGGGYPIDSHKKTSVLLYMRILIVFIFNNNLVVKKRKKMCIQSKGKF